MSNRRKLRVTAPQFLNDRNAALNQVIRPIGISLPFNNPNGIFNYTFINKDQVMSNLKNLLMTSKGERYFQPDFGTDLRRILFENISDEEDFKDSIKNELQAAISFWLPYLVVQEMTVQLNMSDDGRVDDPSHAIGIRIRVSIENTNIYLPIRIFISETAVIRIVEEAV